MGMFWFWAALLVALALVFVLPPLLRRGKDKVVDAGVSAEQRALTLEVYRDQFAELENDLKIGTISQDQYNKAKQDIEKNMLDDVGQLEANAIRKLHTSSASAKASAAVVAVLVPVLGFAFYGMWGAGKAGLSPNAAAPEVAAPEHNNAKIEELVVQLQERLKAQPDDGEGWYMLARTYYYLRRFDEAVEAFKRSVQLGGDNSAEVLSQYADTVAMANNRTLTPEAIELLKRALELDPYHGQSLWLIGTAAYQDQDYSSALEYWSRLLSVLEPGSQDHNQILANVNEVRSLMGMPPMRASAQPSGPMMGSGTAVENKAAASVNVANISGKVSLSSKLAAKADPNDTVFVFARAANGPRMPLAIVRAQVKDLPLTFELNDAMAMNPNMKLSSFSQVVVGARISKSGNAMPQPGDMQGLSGTINVGDNQLVTLVIDSEI